MKVNKNGKAKKIKIFSFKAPHMRAFHMSWMAFFLCFFGWFGIAPLMAVVREEFSLSQDQVGNIIIASVAITVLVRLGIGWLLDKIGPRLAYTALLLLGSLPVMFIGLSNSYESFLLFRLAIGVIGASFVITQYHTSGMFAPNVVGTANATTAGWGNMGGGITQMVLPMVFALFVSIGFSTAEAWRYAMVIPGVAMAVMGVLYYFNTQDTPKGNFSELRKKDPEFGVSKGSKGGFGQVMKDSRVWILFLVYGACFGIELTIYNVAAIYYNDYFNLDLKTAGIIAGLFGFMNIFARTLGGALGDKFGMKFGLNGRVRFLFFTLLLEGVALMIFSRMSYLPLAIGSMLIFGIFVQMSSGATYSVVPFINRKAVGAVAGLVGAGGNAGAVAAGFLFKIDNISYPEALLIIGGVVLGVSLLTWAIRFSPEAEAEVRMELEELSESKNKLEPSLQS